MCHNTKVKINTRFLGNNGKVKELGFVPWLYSKDCMVIPFFFQNHSRSPDCRMIPAT